MALQTANQFQLNTDFSRLGSGIQQGQQIANQFQAGQDRKAKLGQAQQATQLSGQALGGNSEALGGLAAIDPARANQIQTYLSSLSEADRNEDMRENNVMTKTALNALTLPEGERRNYLQQQRDVAANDGRSTDRIDGALAGDDASLNQALNFQAREGQTVESLYKAQFPDESSLEATAGQRERSDLINDLKPALNDQGQIDPAKLTASSQAAAIELGLMSGEGRSTFKDRVLGDEEKGKSLVNLEADIAGGKETAKLKAQGALLPKIRADIKLAEAEAAGRGESLSTLNKAKAALPGLKEVTNRLKTLSEVATYSLGGRSWDALVRETGFGSTKGATARSTMTAIVNNQVLPLLRDTFGSAFTEKEGESLKATILDVNLPPEQRSATLDAFIEQKIRSIETMERELSTYPGVSEADIYETMKANGMTMQEVLEKLKGQTNGG